MKLAKTLEERVQHRVNSGGYSSAEEVLDRALDLLDQQEEADSALHDAIAEGEAALDRGEYVTPEESKARVRAIIERHRP